jgi:hypothetical protein
MAILDKDGKILTPVNGKISTPAGWLFLPAGDAGITRKVKAGGDYWVVQEKKGRRTFTKGIWAPSKTICKAREQVEAIRITPEYKKKMASSLRQRERQQAEYEVEFKKAVEEFLNFHHSHKKAEKEMASAITAHAIPVGSGTVARTSMIPLSERAARAVIAYMRHKTTAYDKLQIARIKGERRKIRRIMAGHSVQLLSKYRSGMTVDETCPLQKALFSKK